MPSQVLRKRVHEEITQTTPGSGKRFHQTKLSETDTVAPLPVQWAGPKVKELVRARSLFHEEPTEENVDNTFDQEEPVPEPVADVAEPLFESAPSPSMDDGPHKEVNLTEEPGVAGCSREVMEKLDCVREHKQVAAFAQSSLGYRLHSIETAVEDGQWPQADTLCDMVLASMDNLERGPPDDLKNLISDVEKHYNFDKLEGGVIGDWYLYGWMKDQVSSGAYAEAKELGLKLWDILELNLFVDYIPDDVRQLVYDMETHEKFPRFRFSDLGYLIDEFRTAVHDRQWPIAVEKGKFVVHRLEVLRRGFCRPVQQILDRVESHPRKPGFMRSAYGFYLGKMRAAAAEGDESSAEYFGSQVLEKLENLQKGVPARLRRLEKEMWSYYPKMEELDQTLFQKYAELVRDARLSGSYDDLEYYCRRIIAMLECESVRDDTTPAAEPLKLADGENVTVEEVPLEEDVAKSAAEKMAAEAAATAERIADEAFAADVKISDEKVDADNVDQWLQLEVELPDEIQYPAGLSSPGAERQVEVHEEKIIRTPDGTKKITVTMSSLTTTISPASHLAKLTSVKGAQPSASEHEQPVQAA